LTRRGFERSAGGTAKKRWERRERRDGEEMKKAVERRGTGFNEKKRRGYVEKGRTAMRGRRGKKERERTSLEDVATAQMQNAR